MISFKGGMKLTALAAFAASSTPVFAENVTADPKVIAAVLQGSGYRAEIKKGEDGSEYVLSGISGYNFSIDFYGCKNAELKCTSVTFNAGFAPKKRKPTLDELNGFAKGHRWGRFYLDNAGDPVIEFDIELSKGGISPELFLENVADWDSIVSVYSDWVFALDDKVDAKK